MKIALNLVLTLPDDGECPALLISCGIIDLQNENNILVKNLDRFRISVPMSYISLACRENLILLVFSLLKKVLSASSYGHLIAAKQCWSQCHIFRFGNYTRPKIF